MIRLDVNGSGVTLRFDSVRELWQLFTDLAEPRQKPQRRKRRRNGGAGWQAAKRRAKQLGRSDVANVRRELAAAKRKSK